MRNLHTTETDAAYEGMLDAGKKYFACFEKIIAPLKEANIKSRASATVDIDSDSLLQVVTHRMFKKHMPVAYYKGIKLRNEQTSPYQILRDICYQNPVQSLVQYKMDILSDSGQTEMFINLVDHDNPCRTMEKKKRMVDYCLDQIETIVAKKGDHPEFLPLLAEFKQENAKMTQAYRVFVETVTPLLGKRIA